MGGHLVMSAPQAIQRAELSALDDRWHERQLARGERRRLGQYATPPELVAWILEWVGYRAGADLEHLALLDPACGSGNFLAGAAQTLIAHGRAQQWSRARVLAALQANLWGLELDPSACALAEMRLHALARSLRLAGRLRWHLHQADALALPAAPRFGLVVGNPPYLASRHHDLQPYRQGYLTSGQRDAYLLFIEQACRFVAPGGWLGLVVPDPLLARGNAAEARRLLLEGLTVRRLVHLEGVFHADVGTLVLIAQRVAPPAQYMIPWSRARWRDACRAEVPALFEPSQAFGAWRCRDVADSIQDARAASPSAILIAATGLAATKSSQPTDARIPTEKVNVHKAQREAALQSAATRAEMTGTFGVGVWRRQPRAELRYLLGPAEAALFERLARDVPSAPLGELARISRGEEIARGAAVPAEEGDASLLPVLRGGLDVRPFHCRFAGVYLRREQVAKPLERYRAPKLLVVKSTGLLQAALDEQGYVAVQTLYLLHARAGQPPLTYLLALLNSRLLRGYLWLHHTAYKLAQPQIEQEALARIPVPLAGPEEQAELAALADELRDAYQERQFPLSANSIAATGQRPGPPARVEMGAVPMEVGGVRAGGPGGGTPVGAVSSARPACANEAAWIQLDQMIVDLSTRLDASVARLCGLTAAERALLERLPTMG